MKHTVRRVGGVVIVDLEGKAAFGTGGAGLREIVTDLLTGGERRILLNMAGVNYIDSGGLGDLVVGFVRASRLDGQLMLLNLSKRHREVLEMTHLIDVIRHFDDEALALDSFATAGPPPD